MHEFVVTHFNPKAYSCINKWNNGNNNHNHNLGDVVHKYYVLANKLNESIIINVMKYLENCFQTCQTCTDECSSYPPPTHTHTHTHTHTM